MPVSSKTVNGALVWYDTDYLARWIDAVGPNVVKHCPDNAQPGDNASVFYQWIVTKTGTSTALNALTAGDAFKLTTGGTEYNAVQAQVQGSPYIVAANKPLYFGAVVTLDATNLSDFLVGMVVPKVDPLKVATTHGITATGVEGFFFFHPTAATTITAKVYVAGAEVGTKTLTPVMDTAEHFYEWYYDGSLLYAYFDNVLVATFAPSYPTLALTPSISVVAGSAVARTAVVRNFRAIQAR